MAEPPSIAMAEPPNDLLQLTELTAQTIVSTVTERFARKLPCTYAGDILISLNPYAWVEGAHSDEVAAAYKGRAIGELPPHLYAIASAIHAAEDSRRHIVICGESGAGKTEAAKMVLRYLAFLETDGNAMPMSSNGSPVPQLSSLLLRTNPLLEAFGNASTERNDNSSRFGKLIEVQYSRTESKAVEVLSSPGPVPTKAGKSNRTPGSGRRISGARIIDFLLEKTRAAGPARGEKNFHIFYYLMAASKAELSDNASKMLPFGEPQQLSYLAGMRSEGVAIGSHERANFREVTSCLGDMDVAFDVRCQLWDLLAATLLLGNLTFAESQDAEGCEPVETDLLENVAILLGISSVDLSSALCHRRLVLGASRASPMELRGTPPAINRSLSAMPATAADKTNVILRPQSPSEALAKRDALASALYAGVFKWLIATINSALVSRPSTGLSLHQSPAALSGHTKEEAMQSDIGVLDIYGFEALGSNSFEQLLINLANERLQQHFNEHVIGRELAEYQREGIIWTVDTAWADSTPCVQLIDTILSATDDTWRFSKDRAADKDLLQSLHARFGARGREKHGCYREPKFGATQSFGILHYAGEVAYRIDSFCRKNKESLSQDVRDLLLTSSSPWIRLNGSFIAPSRPGRGASHGFATPREASTPFGENSANTPMSPMLRSASSKFRPASVSEQFRSSLSELVNRLDTGSRLYVRCIKSNQQKAPWTLDSSACMEQLRNMGVLAAATIRQQGYPRRIEHTRFVQRYGVLLRRPQTRSVHSPPDHLTVISEICSCITPAARSSVRAAAHEMNATWQRGKHKVFLREQVFEQLEKWFELHRRTTGARLVRAMHRSLVHRSMLRSMRIVRCQAAWRGTLTRFRLQNIVAKAYAQEHAERRVLRHWKGNLQWRTQVRHRILIMQKLWRRKLEAIRSAGLVRAKTSSTDGPARNPLSGPFAVVPEVAMRPQPVIAAFSAGGNGRCVAALSPPPAIMLGLEETVIEVAQKMVSRRMEAAVVQGERGDCTGIVTATDIARRVVAKGLDPEKTLVSEIMTPSPCVVSGETPAADALATMTGGRFRHLPVVAEPVAEGGISTRRSTNPAAILDVARCLFDAIEMLERAHAASSTILAALDRSGGEANGDDFLLGPAFCSVLAPTLEGVARRRSPPTVIAPSDSMQHAASLLTSEVTGVLVAEAGRPLGIVTPRSLVKALISGANVATATVADTCMLAPPPTPHAGTTVLEALHLLQDERASHVLLLEPTTGIATAMLDVLQLVCAALSHAGCSSDAHSSQLRSFWAEALAVQQHAETETVLMSPSSVRSADVGPEDSVSHAGSPSIALPQRRAFAHDGFLQTVPERASQLVFKFKDGTGDVHRIPYILPGDGERGSTWAQLRSRIQRRLPDDAPRVESLTYLDDESDVALIHSDETLGDAVESVLGRGELSLTVLPRGISSHTPSHLAVASDAKARSVQDEGAQAPAAAAFLGGLIAASSLAVSVGLLAVKAASASRR